MIRMMQCNALICGISHHICHFLAHGEDHELDAALAHTSGFEGTDRGFQAVRRANDGVNHDACFIGNVFRGIDVDDLPAPFVKHCSHGNAGHETLEGGPEKAAGHDDARGGTAVSDSESYCLTDMQFTHV